MYYNLTAEKKIKFSRQVIFCYISKGLYKDVIFGFQAYYTDPETKLRYATAEEFSRIRVMTSDVVSGCLALRRATTVVP